VELIYSSDCLLHHTGGHPECPERLEAFRAMPNASIPVGEDYLELVHTSGHIQKVKRYCRQSLPLDSDTLTSLQSYRAACAAVAGSVMAAETGGFALVRPPGHHAYPARSSGFCLFNNIAIAVRSLSTNGKKVMILDIDGHLGDGTSATFYDDPNVLFCSLHQYPAFPGGGWVDEIGSGAGKGFTINIPMPPGSADDIFWLGMNFVKPIMLDFNPEIVAVSAGFDGHQNDPLLQLKLSLSCYYDCGQWLRDHFKKVFAVLEGGYNLEFLPKAIDQFYRGINDAPEQYQEAATKSDSSTYTMFNHNLERLQGNLKEYWAL
jgi:acetoin utilization deacetylase AcuC-like enzyme